MQKFIEISIDAAGAEIIGKFLPTSTFKEMNLAKNVLKDEGTLSIAASLAGNLHLHRLVLANNGLSDACLPKLMDAVMVNRHLRDLDLYNNSLTAAGADDVARMLRKDRKGCYFLVFVPTIREIRDFYREM
eukprot:SAG31_NODE_8653_length_1413_cov_1.282344_3_plen_131_part_00